MTRDTRTSLRRFATLVAAATAASLLPLGAAASAEEFIDPADPCLGSPPPAPFVDREEAAEVHLDNIDCSFEQGTVIGRDENGQRYLRPERDTRRDQMASIVVRALQHSGYDVPTDAPDAFTDDEHSVHEENINILAALGIVNGVGDGRYAPDRPVMRDEMVTFLVQTAEVAFGTEFEPVDAASFVDVTPTNPHRDNIAVASNQLGLVMGHDAVTFDPRSPVRRDQIATFTTRLVDLILLDADDPASDPASGPTVGQSGDL